jgi:hypothetical protein
MMHVPDCFKRYCTYLVVIKGGRIVSFVTLIVDFIDGIIDCFPFFNDYFHRQLS